MSHDFVRGQSVAAATGASSGEERTYGSCTHMVPNANTRVQT